MRINTYNSTLRFTKEGCSSTHTIPPDEEGRTNIVATESDQVRVTQNKNPHGTEISFPFK